MTTWQYYTYMYHIRKTKSIGFVILYLKFGQGSINDGYTYRAFKKKNWTMFYLAYIFGNL